MPVTVNAEVRHLPSDESSRVAYDVMHCVFAVHNELGRFFDEDIYRDETARRVPAPWPEVLIEATFRDFRKPYFMDLLVSGGFVFEFKTVEKICAPPSLAVAKLPAADRVTTRKAGESAIPSWSNTSSSIPG